jgi:hypothetical protein
MVQVDFVDILNEIIGLKIKLMGEGEVVVH